MIVFPNCKINLGLRVLDRRADGFHNIESVFYPVKWCDVLEIAKAEKFSFETFGNAIGGNAEDNLCVKAYRLLQNEFKLPEVKMCLLKNIPSGAGLGGGSSDAAFTLKLLNDFFSLNLSIEKLKALAAKLGSDCPFFIESKTCFVSGRGEKLQPIVIDLSLFYIVIIHPQIEVDTSIAYAKLDEVRKKKSLTRNDSLMNVIQKPIEEWKQFLHNDFEEAIFPAHPLLAQLKNQLYDYGALYASMSGSGSAIYGIFRNEPETVSAKEGWKIFSGKL